MREKDEGDVCATRGVRFLENLLDGQVGGLYATAGAL